MDLAHEPDNFMPASFLKLLDPTLLTQLLPPCFYNDLNVAVCEIQLEPMGALQYYRFG
jgi:hypothetical protein